MNDFAPQIPIELFQPEAPSFENFLVGDNEEAVTRLYSALNDQLSSPIAFWGKVSSGKTHLLRAAVNHANALSVKAIWVDAENEVPCSPFEDCALLVADNVDRFDEAKQAWLFNAFNHVRSRAGVIVVAGGITPPQQWPLREDVRTRLASGLVFELLAPPQDAIPILLKEFANQRGVSISNEALTYLLTHASRDTGALCQTITALDRLSLSLKRPITIALIRAYLAQRTRS